MSILLYRSSGLRRWLIFNCVGLMGIVVQMTMLMVLTSIFNVAYLLATALSVEAAVLHNFFWHERWTWADRITGQTGSLISRLLYFHLANGALSMAGNLILMRIFVGSIGLDYLPSNALAIAICAIVNFFAGDRFVFRAVEPAIQKEETHMCEKSNQRLIFAYPLVVLVLLFGNTPAKAAELRPETVKSWLNYVELTERRIQKELESQKGFLALDFQDSRESARDRQSILSGEIPIHQVEDRVSGDKRMHVPDGMIHHWRGSVFIPGIPLDFVLSRVSNPSLEDTRQEDVLDSAVLERSAGQLKLFLKLQRSKIVTVVYNTEHLVRFRNHGNGQASSSSIATKIAELDRIHGKVEREKPQGNDSGFLWRMNSYWRYQQVSGGVIVECESMTLSRSIPFPLEYLVRPIINSVARESMHRTLYSLRTRLTRSYGQSAGLFESRH